jgi:hypothetical protein
MGIKTSRQNYYNAAPIFILTNGSHFRGILVYRLSTGRPDDGDLKSAETCCLSASVNNK